MKLERSRGWSGRISCTVLQLVAVVLLVIVAVVLTLKGY